MMAEVYFRDVASIKGPVLSILKKEGWQAVDMHFHTRYSADGLTQISQVIKRCKKDFIGTSITDHNQINGALKAKEMAGTGVFIIPGMEITCHNGVHILLHFYNYPELKDFYNKEMKVRLKTNPWFIDLDHRELIDLASKYNCLITTPHPFAPGFMGIKKFTAHAETIKKIHAVEVINGCLQGQCNPKAIKWAKKINKGFTGGSDGHCIKELGTSLTLCKADNIEDFLNQIKKRKSIVIGKQERILEEAIMGIRKFIHEGEETPHKQEEQMWKDRGLLEWSYLKKKIKSKHFFHHFHSHHQEPEKEYLCGHEYTKHLVKGLKKSKGCK